MRLHKKLRKYLFVVSIVAVLNIFTMPQVSFATRHEDNLRQMRGPESDVRSKVEQNPQVTQATLRYFNDFLGREPDAPLDRETIDKIVAKFNGLPVPEQYAFLVVY